MNDVVQGSMKYYFIVMMNSISVCAVEVFVIICGYFSCLSNKINLKKIIQLIFQVIVFQLLLFVYLPLVKGKKIQELNVLFNLIPRNY